MVFQLSKCYNSSNINEIIIINIIQYIKFRVIQTAQYNIVQS